MLCYYAAGCISGVAAFLINYPLDTIKTQQQFHGLSFRKAVKRIHRHRGWKGFYRGSFIPLLAYGALNTIFFGLCGDVRDYLMESRLHKAGWYWALSSKIYHSPYRPHQRRFILSSENQEYLDNELEKMEATFVEVFISGAISGFLVLGLSAPVELIKTKLQSQMKRQLFKGPVACFKAIYKEAGVRGLYRGIVPMTIRNFATSGVKFSLICSLFNLCEPDLFPVSSYQTMAAVGVGGLVSWVVALPFDAIKTRMQTDDHRQPYYKGMAHVTREIYRMDGMKGFYRGFWNVSGRAIPLNIVTYLTFDFVQRHWCKRLREHRN